MPAKTDKQRKFFGAELARRRAGKAPGVKGMPIKEVRAMASKPRPAGARKAGTAGIRSIKSVPEPTKKKMPSKGRRAGSIRSNFYQPK